LHVEQGYTYRGLARMFGVSRSLVRFICDPEALQRCRDRIKATWRKYREQRGKDENAKIMRNFRNRKYKMFISDQLTEKYIPPSPRSKIALKTVLAEKPDGSKIDVRLPLSFVNGEGPDTHTAKKWRTERRNGKFFVTLIKK
jgi:hypothetical protein